MQSMVIKYLNKFYYADSYTNIVNDKDDDRVYSYELVDDVTHNFSISEDGAKAIIEVWIDETAPTFDVFSFWEEYKYQAWLTGDGILPIAQRIAAQTVAQDLVPVQPMELPSGLLFYIDNSGTTQSEHYVAENSNINRNRRTYYREAFLDTLNRPIQLGEIDHPDNSQLLDQMRNYRWGRQGVNVSDIMDSWAPIISGMTMI